MKINHQIKQISVLDYVNTCLFQVINSLHLYNIFKVKDLFELLIDRIYKVIKFRNIFYEQWKDQIHHILLLRSTFVGK